ncbi:MAG TPA: serine hydrolase domain-containing protein, partial [Gemmatimonadales bacterium]|nr:serine hydrolase domain-containing protein [Gemmatimonadales bacterium]
GHQATPAPRPAPMRSIDWSPVTRLLDSAVAAEAAPGAVLGVSVRGHRFFHGTGRLGLGDPTRPDSATVYDLASLTKVVGLTTAVMLAVEEGRIDLDAPVSRYLTGYVGGGRDAVTLRHLLTHSAGLPAWKPLYREAADREELFRLIRETPLDTVPGARTAYSDLGVILLTEVLETVHAERIDALLARRVFGPLGLGSVRYLPPDDWRPRVAPTELDPWRGRLLRGEVHDENAARMDGVSGHAGLFGNARDLLAFGEWLLGRWHDRQARSGAGDDAAAPPGSAPPRVAAALVREFTRRQELPPGSSRALGWDTPSPGSSAGTRLAPSSFGHTGFTGTSLWIDPERELVIVLLSNRVHPTRENPRWGPVRARVADLVVETLDRDSR